jgi:hypothetical protein
LLGILSLSVLLYSLRFVIFIDGPGDLTAGRIQYADSLRKKGINQSGFSPLCGGVCVVGFYVILPLTETPYTMALLCHRVRHLLTSATVVFISNVFQKPQSGVCLTIDPTNVPQSQAANHELCRARLNGLKAQSGVCLTIDRK